MDTTTVTKKRGPYNKGKKNTYERLDLLADHWTEECRIANEAGVCVRTNSGDGATIISTSTPVMTAAVLATALVAALTEVSEAERHTILYVLAADAEDQ